LSAAASLWQRVWFRPAHPLCLIATRVIVSLQALWILLSRPDLPDLVRWPAEFFVLSGRVLPARFGIGVLPAAGEQALFVVLHAALLAAMAGLWPRVSCFVSALLLYHFAPFEEVIAGLPHTAFGGLTVPVLALFVLSFAEAPRGGAADSADYRWPFSLVQLLFAFSYFFPLLAKLRFSGPGWFTAENIQYYTLGNLGVTGAPLAAWVAERPLVCGAIALGTLALEGLSPLVVLWPAAAMAFVPAALVFHVAIVFVIGYFFPSLPLLLLLLDWDRIGRQLDDAAA
jgi:hypothetical protein